jgi:DNA-binding NarL/FixJ family response regulator
MSDRVQAHRRFTEEPSLLIVEDSPRLLEALTDMLLKAGFDVVATAVSGRDAISLARALQPDLVLMDIRMPELDGLDTIRLMRDVCPSIEVGVYSAYDTPELRREATEAGASFYLLKGCSPYLIVEAPRHAWERRTG